MEKIEQSSRATQLQLQQMQNHQSEGVVIAGQQERVWGFPISLQGQISNICLFHDSLSSGDVITLYSRGSHTLDSFHIYKQNVVLIFINIIIALLTIGANCLSLFQPRSNEDEKIHSILTDLSNKLVLYYSAKVL